MSDRHTPISRSRLKERSFLFALAWFLSGAQLFAHPAAPTNLSAVADGVGAATFVWNDNSNNEAGFRVFGKRAVDPPSSYILLFQDAVANAAATRTLSLSIPALLPSTAYHFFVQAYNSDASPVSPPSNVAGATMPASTFNAPTNLIVTAPDPQHLNFSFTDNATTEERNILEFRVAGGTFSESGITFWINEPIANNIGGISPSATYEFRVRARKGTDPNYTYTGYSNVVTITAFPSPSNLTVTPVAGQPVVNLAWQHNNNPFEDSYIVEYAQGAGSFSTIATLPANTAAYSAVAPEIEKGKTYTFRVAAVKNSPFAGSFYANAASVTTDGFTNKLYAPIQEGVAFTHTIGTTVNGGTRTGWSVTGLPDGLTFNTDTGAITGTSTVDGAFLCPLTATFSNGVTLNETLALRVLPTLAPPTVGTAIPAWNAVAGQTRDTDLAPAFADSDTPSAIRVSTSLGNMDFILYDHLTPLTVANFMAYVNDSSLAGSFFHRSVPGFVIQGGGFKPAGNPNDYAKVPTKPSPLNEPGISNLRGTVSMAKLGGDPNSATCQFFVSLADNSANLDNQNGGFTVFGRVAGTGMTVADGIASLPRAYYSSFIDGVSAGDLLSECPINDSTAPSVMDQSKLVMINSFTPIPKLAHTVTANTNPAVVTADVSTTPGHLLLTALQGGESDITVTATDLDGNPANQLVHVTIAETFTTWASRQGLPAGETGPDKNPDFDLLNNLQEYALFGNAGAADNALPVAAVSAGDPSYLTLTFPVRKFTQGLTYTVEASDSAEGPWTAVWDSTQGFTHAQVATAQDQPNRTVVTIKDTTAIATPGKRFVRVKVAQQ